MKKLIFLLNCLFSISLINAAFTDNVLVNTPQGMVPLPLLKKGDKVVCYKDDKTITHKTITAVHKRKVDDIFKVITHDGTVLHCCKDAQFYMPKTKEWQPVGKLTNKNWLLRQDMSGIKIKSIEKLLKPTDVFCITVDECSNFYVSEEGILVHNELITCAILTVEFGGGVAITWFEGVTLGTVATGLLSYFIYTNLEKNTGVKVEGAEIDLGLKMTQEHIRNFGCLTYDNNVTTSNSGHVAQFRAVSGTQGSNNILFVHPDYYKYLLNAQRTLKNPHLTAVASVPTGIDAMSITPPDDHVIRTPIIVVQDPIIVTDPVINLKDPIALITPITAPQEPSVVVHPITVPEGPPVFVDPILEKFDSPIVMQGKTPEQSVIDEVLEGAIPGKESSTIQHHKPGGFNGALEDFEKFKKKFPSSAVSDLGDGKVMIILPDGTKIIARPSSSGKVPTLDIQRIPGAGKPIKLRYDPLQEATQILKDAVESEKSMKAGTVKATITTQINNKQKEQKASVEDSKNISIKIPVELKVIPEKIVFDHQPSGLQFNLSNDKEKQQRRISNLKNQITGSDTEKKQDPKPTFVVNEKIIDLKDDIVKSSNDDVTSLAVAFAIPSLTNKTPAIDEVDAQLKRAEARLKNVTDFIDTMSPEAKEALKKFGFEDLKAGPNPFDNMTTSEKEAFVKEYIDLEPPKSYVESGCDLVFNEQNFDRLYAHIFKADGNLCILIKEKFGNVVISEFLAEKGFSEVAYAFGGLTVGQVVLYYQLARIGVEVVKTSIKLGQRYYVYRQNCGIVERKWSASAPLNKHGQEFLDNVLAWNDIRLTEDQRRMIGKQCDFVMIGSFIDDIKYSNSLCGLYQYSCAEDIDRSLFMDNEKEAMGSAYDFEGEFKGLPDVLVLVDKRKLELSNEPKPTTSFFTRKHVEEPQELIKWKQIVEQEYTINRKYLNKENSNKLDILLNSNNIKVTSEIRLRLEKQCAINLKENPDYFNGWILDLNIDNDLPNKDSIRNIGDVWRSRRLRASYSIFARKYMMMSERNSLALLQERQKVRNNIYNYLRKNAELLVNHKHSVEGSYVSKGYNKKLDDILAINKIQLTKSQRLEIEKQLAVNCHINSKYKDVFEKYDENINYGNTSSNVDVIKTIQNVFVAVHRRHIYSFWQSACDLFQSSAFSLTYILYTYNKKTLPLQEQYNNLHKRWVEMSEKFKDVGILEQSENVVINRVVNAILRKIENKNLVNSNLDKEPNHIDLSRLKLESLAKEYDACKLYEMSVKNSGGKDQEKTEDSYVIKSKL